MSDLFVEESCFDGKGFEKIAYINAHFNPSGAVDSFSYIFDLVDIKQLANKLVVTLKARSSWLFALLKLAASQSTQRSKLASCCGCYKQAIWRWYRSFIWGSTP
jgi:hypothetical protein